jgi:hypothetical protein
MFGKTQEKVINLNLIAKYPEFPELPQIRLNFDIK